MSPSVSNKMLETSQCTLLHKQLRIDHGDCCNRQPLLPTPEDRNSSSKKLPEYGVPNLKDEDDEFWMVETSCSVSSSASNISYDDDDENDCESDVESASINVETSTFWVEEPVNLPDCIAHDPKLDHHNINKSKFRRLIDLPRIKEWLAFYSNFVYKTGNQDILLKLMQWSLWLLGAFTPILLTSQEFRDVPQWITKISYDICYARYVTRLLGLPVAIEGALSGSWSSSSYTNNTKYDFSYRVIGHILAVSMIAYYPAEHLAFFLWMNPNAKTLFKKPAEVWFYISMRCWLVYLLTESFQCLLKYLELSRHKTSIIRSKKNDLEQSQQLLKHFSIPNDNDSRSEVTPKELDNEVYNVMLLLARNALYFLPCIHWSMSTWDTYPLLPDVVVNGLMWSEAVLNLYQAIHNS